MSTAWLLALATGLVLWREWDRLWLIFGPRAYRRHDSWCANQWAIAAGAFVPALLLGYPSAVVGLLASALFAIRPSDEPPPMHLRSAAWLLAAGWTVSALAVHAPPAVWLWAAAAGAAWSWFGAAAADQIDHRALLRAAFEHYTEYLFHPREIGMTDDDWAEWRRCCARDYSDPKDTRSDLDHWMQVFSAFTDRLAERGGAIWAQTKRHRDEFAVKAYRHARARLIDYPRAGRLLLAVGLSVGLLYAA